MWHQSKKAFFAALPLAGALCLPPMASADYDYNQGQQEGRYETRYTDQISERDLRSFQRYLDSHQETARRLYQNPERINDRRFVRDHKTLNDWLEEHPEAARVIGANPHRFLQRPQVARAEVSERDLRSFESYLDSNYETAQYLYQDPDLINDRRFLRNHEALDDWLDGHPNAARAIQANPHKYLWRERSVSVQDFLQQLFSQQR